MINFLINAKQKGITLFRPEGYHMIANTDVDLCGDDNILDIVKNGVRTNVLDKIMMFDCNKIKEINYGYGCHSANPSGELVLSDMELKMLHYKFLGLKDYLEKNKIRAKRLSEFNITNNFGTYYMYSDDEHIKDYAQYLEKSKPVI